MANPRKFSEKIALHNQKQAEETARFEQIMKEVSDATSKVSCKFFSVSILHLAWIFFCRNAFVITTKCKHALCIILKGSLTAYVHTYIRYFLHAFSFKLSSCPPSYKFLVKCVEN